MATTHGGARPNAGRPQQRITLDLETARILRELVKRWNAETPGAKYTPSRLVTGFIYIDAMKRGLTTDPKWLEIAEGKDDGEPGSREGTEDKKEDGRRQ